MPELPEVETTRRGLEPHLIGRRFIRVTVYQPRLRWPVPGDMEKKVCGHEIQAVKRRGKYLLIETDDGTLILHLGMSGSLRLSSSLHQSSPHDHVIFTLDNGTCLIFRDPRRFGAVLWTPSLPEFHPLLRHLGPEPLDDQFDGDYLYRQSRHRKQNVKSFIMDQHIVVGVGNIYANEALFCAGIRPTRAAGKIAKQRYQRLSQCIKEVLLRAIGQGGSTLRDFVNEQGQPGYFQLTLNVYGREGLPCPRCGKPIKRITLGQRATYYCPRCQH